MRAGGRVREKGRKGVREREGIWSKEKGGGGINERERRGRKEERREGE